MSGGAQSPHFLQWMILQQHLMASSAVAANLQRLRATQNILLEGPSPGNGDGRVKQERDDEDDEEAIDCDDRRSENFFPENQQKLARTLPIVESDPDPDSDSGPVCRD